MKRRQSDDQVSRRRQKQKSSDTVDETSDWPLYFVQLFKIFKVINTIVTFVSARKPGPPNFSTIRTSAERLLKSPLKLSDVAELKALLPDIIMFQYVSKSQIEVYEHFVKQRPGSPDFHTPASPDEQVLILAFAESINYSQGITSNRMAGLLQPTTTDDTKKTIEKRNNRFIEAVNELLDATPPSEDPCLLLQVAAKDRIPQVNGSGHSTSGLDTSLSPLTNTPCHSVEEAIKELQQQPWYHDQIKDRRVRPERHAQLATFNRPLSDGLRNALENCRGISTFYSHQCQAIDAIDKGKHVIVSTATASGKSIIYQVPLLRMLEENSETKAILIYPTKALAQDQKAALQQLLHASQGLEHLRVDTYDGDTPKEVRQDIRENASVILTNFDTIHASILPHEERWRSFLERVKILAVDELHYYSGLFGCHVAYIIRRLRRVCAALGNQRIQFISCSATISEPLDHMSRIFALSASDIEVITEDGSPSSSKEFITWGCPPIDQGSPSMGRKSGLCEATAIMRFLMAREFRVILFCKIRKICELVMKTLRSELLKDGRKDILERVQPYRGGYNPEERRQIERDAFHGKLLGLVATNALELGVDIGSLDVVIMLGFPFSLASFRQQAGRVGRRARRSMVILVAESAPLDAYYLENPDELFNAPVEPAVLDLDNIVIMDAHLQCAALEMPVSDDDAQYFGPSMKGVCDTRLRSDGEGWYHPHPKYLPYPARFISIRGPIEETYMVIDVSRTISGTSSVVEHIEVSRAIFELYEGGIWLHRGFTFMVKEVDHYEKIAKVIEVEANWMTTSRDYTDVDPIQTHKSRGIDNSPHVASFGAIAVETHVFGFYKVRDGKILETVDLETPPYHIDTIGVWIDVPQRGLDILKAKNFLPAEGIHSAEHAFLKCFAMSEDVKTECKAAEKEYKSTESRRKRPARLIFYDTQKAGGVTSKAFDNVSDLLRKAERLVSSCDCHEGCQKCIFWSRCGEKNVVYNKLGALIILRSILNIRIDMDAIPRQTRENRGHNTIIPASGTSRIVHIDEENCR